MLLLYLLYTLRLYLPTKKKWLLIRSYSIRAMPRPITAPLKPVLTLPAAPGNSEALGEALAPEVADGAEEPDPPLVVVAADAPPGVTNLAVVAIAGISSSTEFADTPEAKGMSVLTNMPVSATGVGVTYADGPTFPCAGLRTL
jgi:hypothetical protein